MGKKNQSSILKHFPILAFFLLSLFGEGVFAKPSQPAKSQLRAPAAAPIPLPRRCKIPTQKLLQNVAGENLLKIRYYKAISKPEADALADRLPKGYRETAKKRTHEASVVAIRSIMDVQYDTQNRNEVLLLVGTDTCTTRAAYTVTSVPLKTKSAFTVSSHPAE